MFLGARLWAGGDYFLLATFFSCQCFVVMCFEPVETTSLLLVVFTVEASIVIFDQVVCVKWWALQWYCVSILWPLVQNVTDWWL